MFSYPQDIHTSHKNISLNVWDYILMSLGHSNFIQDTHIVLDVRVFNSV